MRKSIQPTSPNMMTGGLKIEVLETLPVQGGGRDGRKHLKTCGMAQHVAACGSVNAENTRAGARGVCSSPRERKKATITRRKEFKDQAGRGSETTRMRSSSA